MNPKTIPVYLAKHAESQDMPLPIPRPCQFVVVVPMRGEGETIAPLIQSIERANSTGRILIIAVVNGSKGGKETHHRANEETLEFLKKEFAITRCDEQSFVLGSKGKMELLIVDRASAEKRLPERQGVGLARKIGCDIALEYRSRKIIESPWIHSSDADVVIPTDYFESSLAHDEDSKLAALTYPFSHKTEGSIHQAIAMRLYEISLYYYVYGLEWAGSPYAYQTIGSTIAFRAWNYAAVRGFPKREAGEDFYLLNKLAKTGKILCPDTSPISIRGRFSDRVPFGTGAALNDLGLNQKALEGFQLYNPEVFEGLRATLNGFTVFAQERQLHSFHQKVVEDLGDKAEPLLGVLDKMGFSKALKEALRQAPDAERLEVRLRTWFDSFKTMRFLHQIRDDAYPSIPWWEAIEKAPFLKLSLSPQGLDFGVIEAIREELSRPPTG